jgi:K+-transporting ATPase ATPase C chain
MNAHLRGNLWLVGLMVLVCCVLYPLVVWGIGQAAFRERAQGSLVYGPDGKTPVGSRLIGQPFSGKEYFQPRPSATTPAYNAAASGASNWGASNPRLRDRVARQLGPLVRYLPRTPEEAEEGEGPPVGPDIDKWFARQPDLVASWARDYPTLAGNWAKDEVAAAYLKDWVEKHPEVMADWRKDNPDASEEPKAEDLAPYFFASFTRANPRKWPAVDDVTGQDGKTHKQVQLVTEGADIQATFFDLWLQAHPEELARIKPVPADMVMASGSGLDPHITHASAVYQAPGVARERAEKVFKDRKINDPAQRKALARKVRQQIDALIEQHAVRPISGPPIAGEERIVNVLELNLALDQMRP